MEKIIQRIYFCPNCHKPIELPKMLRNPQMKIGGCIVLTCGYCNKDGKGNKKGKIKIKPNVQVQESEFQKLENE